MIRGVAEACPNNYIISLLACERKNGRNYSGHLEWNVDTMKNIYGLYNLRFKPEDDHSLEYLRVLGDRLQTLRKMIEDYVKTKEDTFNSISW